MVGDWLDILIFPVVLAVGAIGYDSIERQRDERREEDKRNRALDIEDQRAQAVALQTYLDQMSVLMIDKKLRETSSGSDERVLAQARTLTILLALGPDRKRHPLKLVAQMHLIDKESSVIKLPHADLNDANLAEVTLVNVDLRGANLTGARLSGTVLTEADLRGADLSGADLTEANLRDTDLSGADLSGADLTDANVTDEQLATCKSFKGTTMPEGSKHD
jgi:pentapeptide repeat protein